MMHVYYTQAALTFVFCTASVLYGWKIVHPTLNSALPHLKKTLPAQKYKPIAITIVMLEIIVWTQFAEVYLTVMHRMT
tara:strand:+ start:506 stop:739 length:234 start_codon:yes stop_codon:yes gene_type:complete